MLKVNKASDTTVRETGLPGSASEGTTGCPLGFLALRPLALRAPALVAPRWQHVRGAFAPVVSQRSAEPCLQDLEALAAIGLAKGARYLRLPLDLHAITVPSV